MSGTTASPSETTIYRVLFAISIVHLLNDSMQAVIPAILPILQNNLSLTYFQLGNILLVMNLTASILQPLIGYVADRSPRPFILPMAMLLSGLGMLSLAFAPHYGIVLASVALVGMGSAVFHPEASRVAYLASGPRRGLGQSIFQVGGNFGQALAPLMTALIFVPLGQGGAAWFMVPAGIALSLLIYIAFWYLGQQKLTKPRAIAEVLTHQNKRYIAIGLLMLIVCFRSWIHAGFQGFFQLYLIEIQGFSIERAQIFVFIFLMAGVLGTFLGGPLADRFGKRNLIIFSTLGALPLTLLIPFASGFWVYPLLFAAGFILLSSFSISVVYAQEILPGRIGMVSGLIIGFAFGMGGIGASVLGHLADMFGITFIIWLCCIMPAIGLVGFLLPKEKVIQSWKQLSAMQSSSG